MPKKVVDSAVTRHCFAHTLSKTGIVLMSKVDMVRMAWNWQSTTTQRNWIRVNATVKETVSSCECCSQGDCEATNARVWGRRNGNYDYVYVSGTARRLSTDIRGRLREKLFQFCLRLLTYMAGRHWMSW